MKIQSFLKSFNKQHAPACADSNKANAAIYPWYSIDISDADAPDWPERPNGKSVDEFLLKQVNEIFAPYEGDVDEIMDDNSLISFIIMKLMLNLGNGSDITSGHNILFDRCEKMIIHLIYEVFRESPREITVKDIQNIREHIAQQAYEQMISRQESPGNRPSVNALLLLLALDRGRAIEIGPGHNAAVSIPNRMKKPLTLKRRDIETYRLEPVIDLIRNGRNEKVLRKMFDAKIAARFQRIGLDDATLNVFADSLIHKLIHETSFYLQQGTVLLCRGRVLLHPRSRKEAHGSYAIWAGELLMRAIA